MATAEELLARLANPTTEPHIVIDAERFITVPDELKRIAVQFDHNIETVTFDCPRYWDGNDMSQMKIYINYMTPDNRVGSYHSQLVTVDPSDTNIMHFTWTISNNVTQAKGRLSFLVCIKKVDVNGNEVNHWNSELNREMTISEGLECDEVILEDNPDVITHILTRLDILESINGIDDDVIILKLDDTLKIPGRAADAAKVGTEIDRIDTSIDDLEDSLSEVRTELNNKVDTVVYEVDLIDTLTVDPSSTERQEINITDTIDVAALKTAIDEGKTVCVNYTDTETDLGMLEWESATARIKLSITRRYALESSAGNQIMITMSGLVMRPSDNRIAEIRLIVIGSEETQQYDAWVYYTPDSADGGTTTDISYQTPKSANVIKVDSTITITTTMDDGSVSETIIALDANGLPDTITTDGVACDIKWEGF